MYIKQNVKCAIFRADNPGGKSLIPRRPFLYFLDFKNIFSLVCMYPVHVWRLYLGMCPFLNQVLNPYKDQPKN